MKRKSRLRAFLDLAFKKDTSFFFLLASFVTFIVSVAISNRSPENITGLCIFAAGLAFYGYRIVSDALNLLGEKHIPIVVVTGKDFRYARGVLEEAKDAISASTGFKEFKKLEDLYQISLEQDGVVFQEQDLNPSDPNQWNPILQKVQEAARRVGDRLQGKKVYHLFIFGWGITALAAGLGAAFGTKPRVIVHQPSEGTNWKPVLDLSHDIRRIKEVVELKEYKYLDCKWPVKIEAETGLVFNMASKSATNDAKQYLQQKQLANVPLVEVDNKYQGNLKEDDWSPAVQEMFSIYFLTRKKGASKIHLFLNMPTAMAYGLGVAMGNYNEVIIYCWDGKTYHQVFALNQIKSLM
jgi:hypothetical protein